jgi:hypothetical protein
LVSLQHSRTSFLSFLALVIGFDPTVYSVNEDDGMVTLEVAVLDGVLDTDITIQLATGDGSATCKLNNNTH